MPMLVQAAAHPLIEVRWNTDLPLHDIELQG